MEPITLSPTPHITTQPRLAASPQPLRSPSRRQRFTTSDFNNLLSGLSPASTLEALQASDAVRLGDDANKSFLEQSVASASTSERAWGIKAALAGKKIQDWYAEIGQWIWPGFSHPPSEDSANRWAYHHHHQGHTDRGLSLEVSRPSGNSLTGGEQTRGPLSTKLVQEYEKRIETIRNNMETLEIEDLKDYVRNAHGSVGSRRSSLRDSQSTFGPATDYDHLDDFTAVITATIVQALPTISRLETLLNKWSTRLLVLRQVPSFLVDLDSGRESMVSASIAIGAHATQHPERKADFSWKTFSDIRAVLQDQIAELGRKLDRMLDLLEGSADTLPEAWIDGLDEMENEYSAWVVKAERLAMNKELRNERLEKDFTQDHPDEILYLDGLPDLPHTTSDQGMSAQLDETRRRAGSDFDGARQDPVETLETEGAPTERSSDDSSKSFDLDPAPSRNALLEQIRAQLRGSLGNSADTLPPNGLSDGPKTPSQPFKAGQRPAPLILTDSRRNLERPDSPDTGSDTSGSDFFASNYSSNNSSPKIQNAVVAEYIGTPARVKSATSLYNEPLTSAEIAFRRLGPPAEGDRPRMHQHRSSIPSDSVPQDDRRNGGSGQFRTRSASFQSFEPVPKQRIRRIQVQRSGSYSSALSLSDPEHSQVQPSRFSPSSLEQHKEPEGQQSSQSSTSAQSIGLRLDMPKRQPLYHPPPPVPAPLAPNVDREFRPPKQQLLYHAPPPVPPVPARLAQGSEGEPDVSEHRLAYHSPPPVAPRSAHRFEQVSDLSPGSTPIKIRQMKVHDPSGGDSAGHVEKSRTAAGLSPRTFDDRLEERISSILTELPTQIRLTSGPEPNAPEVTRFDSPSELKTPKVRLPAWRLKRRQTSNPLPSMTLAPAQPKNSQSRSPTAEPDIKLYHLHQAGKTAPIKLFVRLVGEGGERVMVRIGGGWADLGEYLREYAGHHGQRSVSDRPFDITGLPSSSPLTNNNQSPRSRPGSRPMSPTTTSAKPSPVIRLARQQTSPAIINGPHTPQSDSSTRNSPRSSWAGTDDVSPSLGLAGPKTKNVDISPRKQAWVDEMMEQARHGGGTEKKNGGGESSVIGDLGKVGRTKRVFFKSRKER